jgi:hypothetical protein
VSPKFYEVPNPENVAADCRLWWNIKNPNADIGPVNTNVEDVTTPFIRLVIVLESPSVNEVRLRRPAVGRTGSLIWQRWHQAQGLIPPPFDPLTDYHRFATEGIYLTELVRCQANYPGSEGKGSRVKKAWRNGHDRYLKAELRKISRACPNAPVLFACGSDFHPQVRQATAFADSAGLPWFVSYHPIGLDDELIWHYNPDLWQRFLRWPKDRGVAFVQAEQNLLRLRHIRRLVRIPERG